MITNQDRSGWFGASDTAQIMGNWETDTFKKWWMVKLGFSDNHFSNIYTDAGNLLEIPIIRAIERTERRRIKPGKHPVYRFKIRLRANYDGLSDTLIEIKTTKNGFDKVPRSYWQQCQVLMHATKKKLCDLYAYQMSDMDYICPWLAEIDPERIAKFQIPYDIGWINDEYMPRIKYFAKCLRGRSFPDYQFFIREMAAGQ